MNKTAYMRTVVIANSCTSLTDLFHFGRVVARASRRLNFFSNLSCSWSESFLKSGGQTFLGGCNSLIRRMKAGLDGLASWAALRMSVANMMGMSGW